MRYLFRNGARQFGSSRSGVGSANDCRGSVLMEDKNSSLGQLEAECEKAIARKDSFDRPERIERGGIAPDTSFSQAIRDQQK